MDSIKSRNIPVSRIAALGKILFTDKLSTVELDYKRQIVGKLPKDASGAPIASELYFLIHKCFVFQQSGWHGV